MPEYLEDPSVLTKDKLKSELLAHNVELPSGNPTKDVFVQLYLKNLTAQNKKQVPAATLDAFSSDEELPPPVVSSRSRSSGRKATRKTDKVQPDELDVTALTDEGLRDELLKQGVDVGPIVASTRKLYEKKLQKLLDDVPALLPVPQLLATDIQLNHNGNSESDVYSDREDEVTPEPVTEPEPAPVVVERPLRSRGKTPITTHTRSNQHQTMVPEDVRPLLTDQVPFESSRRLQRLDSPVWTSGTSTLSRPAQLQLVGEPGRRHRSSQDSENLEVLLNTALLEVRLPDSDQSESTMDPDSALGQRPTARRRRHHASKTSQSPSPLVQVSRVDRSPIRAEKTWSGPRLGCAAGVEKISASEQPVSVEEDKVLKEVLKEVYPNDIRSPTGISASCRRPIRGAAGRPVISSDLWKDENGLFSPKTTSYSYTESHTINRVSSQPPSTSSSSAHIAASSRLLSAVPPAGPTKPARRGMSLWIKLSLLGVVAGFLFLVYQAMETTSSSPFGGPDEAASSA
ncbi:thymopoietin a isoform X2 [Melanotaenia boesemani]|uniref:thymopoietin a isoform X2 n=1 Tax=Melanotaenia boesemani TaxID=1250792 RepID=UPI001C03CF3A|nr:thymopoietin a isoform X2 [Melanotaenia boesemani]